MNMEFVKKFNGISKKCRYFYCKIGCKIGRFFMIFDDNSNICMIKSCCENFAFLNINFQSINAEKSKQLLSFEFKAPLLKATDKFLLCFKNETDSRIREHCLSFGLNQS